MEDPNYCLWIVASPCRPLDWWTSGAAWAQAVFTGLAILTAGIYTSRQEQRRAALRVAAITKLVYTLGANIQLYGRMLPDAAENQNAALGVQFDQILALRDQLAAFPLHEVSDSRVIDPITRIQASINTLVVARTLQNSLKVKGDIAVIAKQQELVAQAEKAIRRCHVTLLDICASYRRRLILKKADYS